MFISASLIPSSSAVEKVIIQEPLQVVGDQVKIYLEVRQADNKPVVGLHKQDFQINLDGKSLKEFRWKSPEQSVSPPAWIIVLLDMSGSMKSPDSSGTPKLHGALQAIRELIKSSARRSGNTQISIVPFGEKGKGCLGFEEYKDPAKVDNFFSARDVKLKNYLDYLENQVPCASTNIYEPVKQSLEILGNQKDLRFHVMTNEDHPNQPKPRLSIILLTDGYQNTPNEAIEFKDLMDILDDDQKNSDNPIIVHTLGYGLSAEQLGKKYNLGYRASRGDIKAKRIPEEEYVDQEKMEKIANSTGGIAEFSANAKQISQRLQLFLDSLLGQYEISYTQPQSERGSKHQVRISVDRVSSKKVDYTITVFGRSLPLRYRLLMLGLTLVLMGLGGLLPFIWWGRRLKAEQNQS
jgi:hypothetical protein